MKKIKKVAVTFFIILSLGLLVFAIYEYYEGYNQFVHCVVVEEENDYIDKSLIKSKKSVFDGRSRESECVEKDSIIDKRDGSRNGKVRWINCIGIDCDEMYK